MSLQSFQSALALVIRNFDAQNTKDIDDLARVYELSSDEKMVLENVIRQQRLIAYSEELFLARWTIISEALEYLQPYVDFAALRQLWEHDFERKSAHIVHEDLVLRFVQYLSLDEKGSKFISAGTPAFLPCLVRYLYAVFTFRHNYLPRHDLSPHSLLTDRYFEVIKLNYDVREFFAELVELEEFTKVQLEDPPKGEITLLFIASDQVTEFRSFEIDQELANFFAAELSQKPSVAPPCYEELVDMGLCKPRGVRRPCCSKIH